MFGCCPTVAGSDPAPAHDLPHLRGKPFVTDGGMETDLIFHHGVDLPHFAAYLLLEDDTGRALLTSYYDGYAAIAQQARVGLCWSRSPGEPTPTGVTYLVTPHALWRR